MALLAGFPDRVAQRRDPDGTAVVFAGGGSAEVGRAQPGAWLVALDVVDARRAGRAGIARPQVRLSARIEPEWLLDLFPDRVTDVDRRAFNAQTERVEQTSGLAYGGLMLDARTGPAPADDETARLLADAALARGIERLPGGEDIPALLERIAFVRQNVPEAPLPDLGADALAELIRMACVGRVGFADLAAPGRRFRRDDSGVAVARSPPRAGDAGARPRAAGRRAKRGRALRGGGPALDRVAPAGLLRDQRGARDRRWARAVDGSSAGAERPRRSGHARPGRVLAAALSGAAARAGAPLPEARLAGGRRDRAAAPAQAAAPATLAGG